MTANLNPATSLLVLSRSKLTWRRTMRPPKAHWDLQAEAKIGLNHSNNLDYREVANVCC